jgi:hypothetical protein
MKPLFQSFQKHSNLSTKCPLPAGFFYLKNFNPGDAQLPIDYIKFKILFNFEGSIKKSKRKEHFCTFKFIGEYKKTKKN